MQYNFEWDLKKARLNLIKHKIRFEIAATVFKDPKGLTLYDLDYSEKEDRWLTMGLALNGILLVVHHTFKKTEEKSVSIRIISSRKATKSEKKQYNN